MERHFMLKLVATGLVLGGLLGIPPTVSAEVRYTVTDLSATWEASYAEPENVKTWYAMAINDVGQVAGYTETTDNSNFGTLWDDGNGLQTFPEFERGSLSRAINDLGQIVLDGANAYLWDPVVGFQELHGWGQGTVRPRGVNDLGQVVGSHAVESGAWHPFLWQNGVMQDLGTLGGDEAQAGAVNNLGQVVGWSDTADGTPRAFLWDPSGVMYDLGTLGGASIACDINDLGQVVGQSPRLEDGYRAFLWEDGDMICIDTLEGESSAAVAINNHGQAVGTWNPEGDVGNSAFVWDSINGMVDLNDLIDTVDDWRIVQAFDINNDGWIVATGRNYSDGEQPEVHAVLLRSVPEPSTVVLLITIAGIVLVGFGVSHAKTRKQP